MIYFFSLYLILIAKKSRVTILLVSSVIFSLFCGFLISKTSDVADPIDIFYLGFTCIILFLLIHGFSKYKGIHYIKPYTNEKNFKRLIRVLIVLGLITFFINLFITVKAFSLLTSGDIIVESYKNDGGAAEYLTSWVPSSLLLLTRLISPIGYFALGLHFYFLTTKQLRFCFLFLIVALNIPLLGFHGLSRSAAIQFLLIYTAYMLYTFKAIDANIRRKIVKYGVLLLTGSLFLLGLITTTRFSEYYNVPSESKVKNTVIYSLLDYAGQWGENGVEVMKIYEPGKLMYGKSTTPIVGFVLERVGIETERLVQTRYRVLGDKYDGTFNGVVVTLLYDFGYIFTILLSILFYRIVRKNAPKNGVVSLQNFINFGVLIPLPLMFFANNVYSNLAINIGIIYLIFFNIAVRIVKN